MAMLLWLGLFSSCSKQNQLVVYADPWLGEFAREALDSFQVTHPAADIHLRELSTEVIVQHLHFGQPIDVVLGFGMPEVLEKRAKKGKDIEFAQEKALANTRIVEVVRGKMPQQTQFDSEGCVIVAASDRPLRHFTEAWMGALKDSCILYADFYTQTRDYLLRGWGSRGFVPEVLARKHANLLKVRTRGPVLPAAFSAYLPASPAHPSMASAFFDFLGHEKTKELLAKMHLND
ncbi:MAG: hypothetical protein AAF570_19555 [Bacteroidota bacterium]